jgi:hypothetical protein
VQAELHAGRGAARRQIHAPPRVGRRHRNSLNHRGAKPGRRQRLR